MVAQGTNSRLPSLEGREPSSRVQIKATGWTVGRKLLLGFSAVAGLIAVVAGIGFAATATIRESFEQVTGDVLRELAALGQIRASASAFLGETYLYVLFGEEYDLEKVGGVLQELDRAVKFYTSVGEAVEGEAALEAELEGTGRLQAAVADLKATSAEMVALHEKGAGEERLEKARDELEKAELTLEAALAETEGTLAEELAEAETAMTALIARVQLTLVIVPVTVLLLTLGVGHLLSRSIVSPIKDLTGTARRIAAGDLERVASVTSKDEVGTLARAFNNMTIQLRQKLRDEQERREYLQATVQTYVDYMAEVARGDLSARLILDRGGPEARAPLHTLGHNLNETTASLQRMTLQIRDAANNLSAAAAEILTATSQQVTGAGQQAAAIAQASSTIDEVRTIAEQTAQRAQGVADLTQSTAEVSRTGRQAVADTIGGMVKIQGKAEAIAGEIQALSEQTQAVGQIIATVNEIAAQSNMLALNAAVEAARAGEAGRGFAVVAAEVRRLAEQSRAATDQVKEILQKIQCRVDAAVTAAESGMGQVEAGVRLAGETGEAIRHLAENVAASTQAVGRIAAAASQQRTGMEQVGEAIRNIHQVTAQNVAGARQVEQAAAELNDLAGQLRELVEQYRL